MRRYRIIRIATAIDNREVTARKLIDHQDFASAAQLSMSLPL
jgi:hypothetical protein